MPGRDVSATLAASPGGRPRRLLIYVLAALALVGIGIAIGSRITAGTQEAPTTQSLTQPAQTTSAPKTGTSAPAYADTPAGAEAAAARSITAFDGDVLLDPIRLRAVVERMAAPSARTDLVAAFEQAGAQTRTDLGVGTVPRPVVVLRSAPVGYRVESYSPTRAQIAVWYVGIVGSGATVAPQQSWRTQIVSLVWDDGAWKVTGFRSSPGPTPPLSANTQAAAPGELFTTIPSFHEFTGAQP